MFGPKDVSLCGPRVLDDLLKQVAYLEVQTFLKELLIKHDRSEVLNHIPDDLAHLFKLIEAPKLVVVMNSLSSFGVSINLNM